MAAKGVSTTDPATSGAEPVVGDIYPSAASWRVKGCHARRLSLLSTFDSLLAFFRLHLRKTVFSPLLLQHGLSCSIKTLSFTSVLHVCLLAKEWLLVDESVTTFRTLLHKAVPLWSSVASISLFGFPSLCARLNLRLTAYFDP